MPDSFYKHVKQLKAHAYLQMITITIAIITCGLALGMLSTSGIISACFAAISIFSFIIFFLLDKVKNKSCPDFYTAIVSIDDIENTLLKYEADKISDDAYVCFCTISRFHARILILLEDEFEEDVVKSRKKRINRIINRKYDVSREISISESYTKLRINLLVVNCDGNGIRSWINKNAAVSLRRAEPIINAAIVLDKKELLFPSLRENVRLNELNKYLAAAEMLTRIFCS